MEALLRALAGGADLEPTLTVALLVAARLAPVTLLAPWLSLRAASPIVRASVALVLTVALTPLALGATPTAPPWSVMLAPLVLREALLGSVYAIAVALPLHALDWSGRLADTWRGAALAEVLAPPTGERTTPLGDLAIMLGVALFVATGGHRIAMGALADSLVTAPVGGSAIGSVSSAALGAARLVGDALALSAAFAAPVAVAVWLTDVGLGLLARATPTLPLFFAGMPLRAAAGLGAVLLALTLVVEALPSAFRRALAAADELLRALAS